MMYSFEKNYKDLPKLLPLFPLKRVLLLPRAKLPLNLFENRYLHMFDFALSNGRTIGIIQPNEKLKSNKDIKNPNLYSVCLLYTSPSPRDRTRSRMPSSA